MTTGFPWLSRKLRLAGHFSKRVMLAQSASRTLRHGRNSQRRRFGLDEDTIIIVAHSLGSLATAHYLNQRFQAAGGSIKAGIFAAGFKRHCPARRS